MTTHDPYDLLVIGSGPGGIAAACVAAEAGHRVGVVDAGHSPGGQIWRGGLEKAESSLAKQWLTRFDHCGAEFLPNVQIVSSGDGQELIGLHGETVIRLPYKHAVLATGAREVFLPFPGWTTPGVMGAGGIQAALKSGQSVKDKEVIIAGTGPLLIAVAASLRGAGARVTALVEQAPFQSLLSMVPALLRSPTKLMQAISYQFTCIGIPYMTSSYVSSAERADGNLNITVESSGKSKTMRCDILACGFHLTPNLELPRLLGCTITDGGVHVNNQMKTSQDAIYAVGELLGIGGVECALVEGQIAGHSIADQAANAQALIPKRNSARRFAQRMNTVFTLRDDLKTLPAQDTIICRCEDVTHGQLQNKTSWREAKLYTRCGMGPCQGRVCGSATQALYGWTQETTRPPLFPVPATFWAQLDE